MKQGMSLRVLMAGVALAASALLAGCASAPPRAERFVAAPAGTAYAFHRRSTGSFGTMDGTVDWTLENREWQGKPVMAQVSPQAGTVMHELSSGSFGYVATLNPRGQTSFTFEPPVGYRYPLELGKSWSSSHKMTLHPSGQVLTWDLSYKIEDYESLTVPAGTFKVWRIAITDNFGQVDRYWIDPDAGIPVIKRTQMRPASHPQGAGTLEGELISLRRPK